VILIWRGWGLLAIVALFPLMASCAGLSTIEPPWVFLVAAALSLLVAGVVCVHCGLRWNRHGAEHSFYFVPLQVWGWVYLSLVSLLALVAIAGAFKQGLDQPGRLLPADSLACPICGSPHVEPRPPSRISPYPGYHCRDCGALMRAPGTLPLYLFIVLLGSGFVGLFAYLSKAGEAGPWHAETPLIALVCVVYSLRQLWRPVPSKGKRGCRG
jgi:hypothetical protein